MNMTLIVGRLIRDPESGQTADGKPKTTFTVAVDRPYKPAGAQYPESDFYYCIAYGRQAEFVAKHFNKGNAIGLTLQYRQYKKQDKTTSHFFQVDRADFVPQDRNGAGLGDGHSAQPAGYPDYEPDITDDDMPF